MQFLIFIFNLNFTCKIRLFTEIRKKICVKIFVSNFLKCSTCVEHKIKKLFDLVFSITFYGKILTWLFKLLKILYQNLLFSSFMGRRNDILKPKKIVNFVQKAKESEAIIFDHYLCDHFTENFLATEAQYREINKYKLLTDMTTYKVFYVKRNRKI